MFYEKLLWLSIEDTVEVKILSRSNRTYFLLGIIIRFESIFCFCKIEVNLLSLVSFYSNVILANGGGINLKIYSIKDSMKLYIFLIEPMIITGLFLVV